MILADNSKTPSYFLNKSNWDITSIINLIMNLHEYHIPIIPLSECESIKINYDGETLTIPNQRILNELIIAPIPDLFFITHMLRQYSINQKLVKEIQDIFFCEDNSYPYELFLGKALDKLATENCNKKLISTLALEIYKFSRLSDDDDKSQLIVKKISDSVVVKLRSEIRNPSPSDVLVKNFINKKEASYYEVIQNSHPLYALELAMKDLYGRGENVNYKLFKYYCLILEYIDYVAPLPINYLSNTYRDTKVSFFLQDWYGKITSNITKIELDKKQEKYHENRKESVRRKCVVFTDYHRAKLYLSNVERILVKECPEYFTELIINRHERDSLNDKNYRQKNLVPLISQQCQFCSQVRQYTKLGTGNVNLSCENPECKEKQKEWTNHIKRLNTLRESTLKKGR